MISYPSAIGLYLLYLDVKLLRAGVSTPVAETPNLPQFLNTAKAIAPQLWILSVDTTPDDLAGSLD